MKSVVMNNNQTGLIVSGYICFSNVLRIRQQGNRLINQIANSRVDIDLSNVISSDVSGLSLLLRWLHYATKQSKQIHYLSIPPTLLKIAHVCGIAQLISE